MFEKTSPISQLFNLFETYNFEYGQVYGYIQTPIVLDFAFRIWAYKFRLKMGLVCGMSLTMVYMHENTCETPTRPRPVSHGWTTLQTAPSNHLGTAGGLRIVIVCWCTTETNTARSHACTTQTWISPCCGPCVDKDCNHCWSRVCACVERQGLSMMAFFTSYPFVYPSKRGKWHRMIIAVSCVCERHVLWRHRTSRALRSLVLERFK